MEQTYCIVGESDMKDFTPWWESHLSAFLVIYCREGEAILNLQFKDYCFRPGMMAIVPPDMFPTFSSRSETFRAFYCLMNRDFAEKSLYDIPNGFYDALYVEPVLSVDGTMNAWMNLLDAVHADGTNAHRESIFSDLVHAFALDYYDKWKRQYGDRPLKDEKNSAEAICTRFYSLVFDHCREHHTAAYYADRLCITPNYLAMVTRQVCNETPKQAIDRQVTLEMKYLLRNTTLTAEQIALSLHFPDTSYMCRFFRRQTGCSLSEYRRKGVMP